MFYKELYNCGDFIFLNVVFFFPPMKPLEWVSKLSWMSPLKKKHVSNWILNILSITKGQHSTLHCRFQSIVHLCRQWIKCLQASSTGWTVPLIYNRSCICICILEVLKMQWKMFFKSRCVTLTSSVLCSVSLCSTCMV